MRRDMDRLWTGLTSRAMVAVVIVLLLTVQIVAFSLPQIPVPASEAAGYGRWLAELQPRLGDQTRLLASLGLLTIRGSWITRLCLALVALVVAVNADAVRAAWQAGAPARDQIGRLLVGVGGILIIAGWGAQMLWGWRDPEVITWPGDPITVAERGIEIAQPRGPAALWTGRYGIYALRRGRSTGLELQVTEDESVLGLLPSVDEAPQETLRVTFTTRDPEAFFAVPEAGLIFRLNQLDDAVQIQAYRSARGDLLVEHQLQVADGDFKLAVNGAEVAIGQTLLPRYEVIYNPGAWVEVLGVVLLAAGGIAIGEPAAAEEDEAAPNDDGTESE